VVAVLALAITGTAATAAHAAPSADLTKKINKAQDALEDITEAYNKMTISLNQTIKDEQTLAASLGPARDALAVAGKQVNVMAASAYKTGQVGPMSAILDGNSSQLLDKIGYLDVISRGRQRDINTYTATTANYTDRQAALKTTQAKQAAESKALKARKTKIESDLAKLLSMRKAAYGKAQDSGSSYTGPIPSIAGSAGKAVTYAYQQIGDPYHYASSGPSSFDCSGLTMAAWAAAGKSLPHNAAAQYSATSRISKAALQPGDLVFYRGLAHVGLYVGGGMIIDAPHTGTTVGKRSINIMPPYGYGRVR
jgi:peptidoglycan DL-endopeptidase CwlO